jgi:hypothetical protein
MAAVVACPAYLAASRSARCASFFTICATSIPENRLGFACPYRFTDRNSGPVLMAAFSSHAWRLRTGQVSGFDS